MGMLSSVMGTIQFIFSLQPPQNVKAAKAHFLDKESETQRTGEHVPDNREVAISIPTLSTLRTLCSMVVAFRGRISLGSVYIIAVLGKYFMLVLPKSHIFTFISHDLSYF